MSRGHGADHLDSSVDEVLGHLDKLPAFAAWPAVARRRLAEGSRIVSHAKGRQVLAYGDPCTDLVVILRGTLMTCRNSPDGRQNVMFYWHGGDMLGLAPIFGGGPFSFDLHAQSRSRLLYIPAQRLLALVGENPRLLAGLLEVIQSHYRLTIEMFCRQTLMSLRDRMIDRLLFLAETKGLPTREGVLLDIRLSQAELAAMLSATRQSVNKELRWLADQGLIAVAYNSVTVTNLPGLRKLCQAQSTLPIALPRGPVSPLSRVLLHGAGT